MSTRGKTNLHLFCIPGTGDIRNILDASRPSLEAQAHPVVAYLPAAASGYNWLEHTVKSFQGLAQVELIDAEMMGSGEVEAILERAGVLYIPGGNTNLLSHRLHEHNLIRPIQDWVRKGLPVVAFSAGTILCGPNILTNNDMNLCATPHFGGLDLVPYNFYVHYPSREEAQASQDDWLAEYFVYHTNPVLAMEDDAYVHASESEIILFRGTCWLIEKGISRQALNPGWKTSF